MIIRRRVNLSELWLKYAQDRYNLVRSVGEEPKMHVDITDFAPEGYKVGSKVIDPETMLKGEVIGYEEWDILLPTGGREEG